MADPKPLKETACLARDFEGRDIVSVHAKVTYAIAPDGRCLPSQKPQPFLGEKNQLDESDVVPFKTATDLIVMASAQAPKGAKFPEMLATIELGKQRWAYRAIGERKVIYRGKGSVDFSQPVPTDGVPLTFALAYGGIDTSVTFPEKTRLLDALGPHPGCYLRNPIGLGYAVKDDKARLDGLPLPNVENPEDSLTPQNFLAGEPRNWWRQPIPWACDWFPKGSYPRCAWFGGVPLDLPEDDQQMKEVRLGWVEPFQLRRAREKKSHADRLDPRMGNAAAPALTLPFLKGDESIRLRGMSPTGELVVQLPGKPPRMKVKVQGKEHAVVPVANRVVISVLEMGVYVVWHGAWRSPKPFPYRTPAGPGETDMGRAGIEAFVDDVRVTPLF